MPAGTTVIGSLVFPALPTIWAPIWLRGLITLPIGRLCRELSPVKTDTKSCGASMPIIRRKVVPELPASSSVSGSFRPCRPLPVTTSSVGLSISTFAPRLRITPTVERQSAEGRKLVMRTGVSPSAENITLRWETDLSPGMTSSPRNPFFIFSTTLLAMYRPPIHFMYIMHLFLLCIDT